MYVRRFFQVQISRETLYYSAEKSTAQWLKHVPDSKPKILASPKTDLKFDWPSGLWIVKIYMNDDLLSEERFLLANNHDELAELENSRNAELKSRDKAQKIVKEGNDNDRYYMIKGSGKINGGGDVINLKTSNGNIKIKKLQ